MAEQTTEDSARKKRGGPAVAKARVQLARVILLVFTLVAAMLAIGALLVALRHNINEDNAVVRLITQFDDLVDGPLGRDNGIFAFHGKNEVAKEALVNWGIAALVYLLIGRVLARVVRP